MAIQGSIAAKFSPNLKDQSSCRILTTHAKARPMLHDDWSIRLGENRPDRALKHMAAILYKAPFIGNTIYYFSILYAISYVNDDISRQS